MVAESLTIQEIDGSKQSCWQKKECVVTRNVVVVLSFVVVVALIAVGLIGHYATDTSGPDVSPTPPPTEAPLTIRLPTNLVPRRYEVTLLPTFGGDFTIFGSVVIQFEVMEQTSRVVLHMADIVTINSTIKITEGSTTSSEIPFYKHEYIPEFEYYIGYVNIPLEEGHTYYLSMEFTGFLNNDLRGFYRSVYTNEDGEQEYIATTSFEPDDARRAFPCFDEPALKANFSISIAREEHLHTVSNMPLQSSTPMSDRPGWYVDKFEDTLPMSTYLLAFIISDFVAINTTTSSGTPFQVMARRGAIDMTSYALELGANILPFYESYFNISYPLPKQDMFAIPDFLKGAMEDWGLVIYRESLLIYDPNTTSAANKQASGADIAHELSHQWFGDLVTPSWWVDLWLNEGFATYMGAVGINEMEPTWEMLDQFVPTNLHYSFVIDALNSSHPVSVPVSTPTEIMSLFDPITYSKGGSIIRMMMNFLTEETFNKGINNYLKNRAYSSAQQDQLWSFLTDQAHADKTLDEHVTVKDIMDTWTLQMGYPVLTLIKTANGSVANIRQNRFLLTGTADADYLWWIPLSFQFQSDDNQTETYPTEWMSNEESFKVLSTAFPSDKYWVIINVQQTGYYRVNYERNNWLLLVEQLRANHSKISNINRAQILDDSLNLARAGLLFYVFPFALTTYLVNETDYIPWTSALTALDYVEKMFAGQDKHDLLNRYLLKLVVSLYDYVGFEDSTTDDPHMTQLLRILATGWACRLGHQDCLVSASTAYQAWVASGGSDTAVSPNLKGTVYCNGIAQGNTDDWNFAWNVSQTTNFAAERDFLFSALACSTNKTTLKLYLDKAFHADEGIRRQDVTSVFNAVAGTDTGRDVAWDYLDEHFVEMLDYTSSDVTMGGYVETTATEFNTKADFDKLEGLRAKYSLVLGEGDAAVGRAVARAAANIVWVAAYHEVIVLWLQLQYPTSTLGPRLPSALVPVHYEVRLQPFIGGNFSIHGSVTIAMITTVQTRMIVLHMADIITHNDTIKVTNRKGEELEILKHEYVPEYQYYVATLRRPMKQNDMYTIDMHFEGYLNNELRGFYRASYKDEDGHDVPRLLAVTQMAPTDARRVFPCFDEPEMKATFGIFLAREENMTAVSNMPVKNTTDMEGHSGWVWDEFEMTRRMSTYLLAFLVSDLTTNSINISTTDSEIDFGVTARGAVMNQTAYALHVGPSVLEFYEEFFQVPYKLPKEDLVAVPDFSAGAMGNWGLVTFSETSMLYDAALSTAEGKQTTGIAIAHELAHQWVGDLVTPAWWTDLWLSEGFATYMQYIGLSSIETDWALEQQTVVTDLQGVFAIDSLLSSHPIISPVNTTAEITALFDSITYSKGASLLRMISNVLTMDTFKKGVTTYLKNGTYKSVTQADLWAALTAQAAKDDISLPGNNTVQTIMDGWTLQMGYPYISVVRTDGGTVATVTQKRFLTDGSDGPNDKPYTWIIPLSFISQKAPNFTLTAPSAWLEYSDTSISDLPTADHWVLFNVQETGYYRVNYDDTNWEALIQQLFEDHLVIHAVNRAQLLDDSLNLARAGILEYNTALELTGYLVNETEYVPWLAGLNGLAYIESMFTRSAGYGQLKMHLLSLVVPLYELVGFDDSLDDSHLTQLLRVPATWWACHLGHQPCVTSAVEGFQDWVDDNGTETTISPNSKLVTYCTGVAEGGEQQWDFVWQRYLHSSVVSEKSLLLAALGCSKEIWILSRFLGFAFTEGSGILEQDVSIAFAGVAANDDGRDLAWSYLSSNWDAIATYLSTYTTLSTLLTDATAEFSTEDDLRKLLTFQYLNADSLGSAARAVEQAVERTTNNIAWGAAHYDDVLTWVVESLPHEQ